MPVFTRTAHSKVASKVHHSQYLKSEDTPKEPEAKPVEPANPGQPEAS